MRNIRDGLGAALLAAAFNVAVLPLAGGLLCRMGGLSPEETLLTLIFLACPTASSATFMPGNCTATLNSPAM
jgi:predicted permease